MILGIRLNSDGILHEQLGRGMCTCHFLTIRGIYNAAYNDYIMIKNKCAVLLNFFVLVL